MPLRLKARCSMLLFGLALAGCTVAESNLIDLALPYAGNERGCKSTLGSYSLPRAYVQVKIQQQLPDPPVLVTKTVGNLETLEVIRRADPTLTSCLDYLQSAFAHDTIEVIKDVKTGVAATPDGSQFLRAVIINSADRTSQILRTLIRTFFLALSGDPGFEPTPRRTTAVTQPLTLVDVHYDPFDVGETARTNARLTSLGYCFVLDGFSFNEHAMSVDQYCAAPQRALEKRGLPIAGELYEAMAREPVPSNIDGIIYRARQTYMISVYRKTDPGGRRGWVMERRVAVDLENLSPVVAVRLPRSAFATRGVALVFDQGVLLASCALKTSEIENFVSVPYEVVRSIVALPSRVFQIKIDRATKSKELVAAETRLFQIQEAHLKALQTGKYQSPGAVTITDPKAYPQTVTEWPAGLTAMPAAPKFEDAFFGTVCRPETKS